MKIAVTGQNFRTITPHTGKTRRILIFELDRVSGEIHQRSRLNPPKQMSMHQ
ncbi:MAG: hypothetical protein AB2598_07025 [Candidatus Thiodiazotropha sp.]